MIDSWPAQIEVSLESFLDSVGGTVIRRFGMRADSRSTVLGVEVAGDRYVIKHASDGEAIGWLRSALQFHTAVSHQAIATVVHHLETGDGLALVQQWVTGEVLVDEYDDAVLERDHPLSAYRRFIELPPETGARAVQQILDAHVRVAAAGFVAVDLYDGCVVYDFDRHRVSLVDLDHYRPGPYTLEKERQIGSATYMAPEEFSRGAVIDERATIYTLGRMAQVYLGCARDSTADRGDFRGSSDQFDVAAAATSESPESRFPTVRALREAWATTL